MCAKKLRMQLYTYYYNNSVLKKYAYNMYQVFVGVRLKWPLFLSVYLNSCIRVQASVKNDGAFCVLTRLHSRITQNNSIHNGRNASSLPVDGVNFEVKGTLSIQSGQGKCRFVQSEIVENSSAFSWTGLVCLEEERLRKPAVKAWLTSYFYWCACSIYYATVLDGLRHIWKKGKFSMYVWKPNSMNEWIHLM